MVKIDHISHKISLIDGVKATMANSILSISKGNNSLTREFIHTKIEIRISDDYVTVFCNLPRRSEKALSGTWAAHIKNMVNGVDTGFEYHLKAVYSHFPMTLKVSGNKMTVNNLFGEKVPRVAKLPWSPSDVEVKISNKTDVVVKGIDKEKVGQTAANIERSCRIKNRDRRVFQDGIYITSKGA
ncbi:MAG: 50S ribosomal protein L6 [Euryarchaeota archaeon]|jgi:large subunit ribosomal protein L6|nr:50S ribosomal protein L6 [Euryarchaeota archaeon]MBT4391091.1 50S ribosomal protein L6 [Euryarchaeota archaeon]MBT4803079.1 50S ribosomal protein L6 [Euryarchaeota archaeon]MBT5613532.1 50S ribosomal protein L6 [Euryarchaeota archaeon]MBT6683341.1 50S ribosomal protein L6 [Euryarchaeota archaeon]